MAGLFRGFPVLIGKGLCKSYGSVVAVRQVDVTVQAGEVVGLLGPNGAGKTTTFRLLAGLDSVDAGQVLLGDLVVTSWPLHRRARGGMGYLSQGPSVFPRLSARQNLEIACRAARRPVGDAQKMLEEAGLELIANRLARDLSGGERRRLEVVRCLTLRPRVVLMDEPFSGVDPIHVSAIQKRIRSLKHNGTAVLITDHAVQDTLRICDRAYVLDRGDVMVSGTPQEVASDSWARDRYFGHDFCLEG
jgi:lipopolysaccharide export system ATP-binding protein